VTEQPEHKGGMPPHEPNSERRELVKIHTIVGTRQEIIADLLGIDDKTLRKYYREELDHSKAQANAVIGGALFNKAKAGDGAAQIFWMKTQAGWKETAVVRHEGPGGGPVLIDTEKLSPEAMRELLAAAEAARDVTPEADEG
jgi:hypothetical protein